MVVNISSSSEFIVTHPKLDKDEDVHNTLVRAGFLRQTHAGIFHMLPLGFRVQHKLESLIDYHMQQVGASKVALSTVSSEHLWKASGRLEGKDSELFRFKDRKDTKFLLSPTHEEEITSLVATSVQSYRDLPLRLYQVTRKYRDEARPRQGLLRGREFLMKDLYTFDSTIEDAISTYDRVRAAYRSFFTDLRTPFLTAAADSGSMGGNFSHEYHLPSPTGEDTILVCDGCGKTMNEEVAIIDMDEKTAVKVPANETCQSGKIDSVKAIEVGHTFYLGDRYSAPLKLQVKDAQDRTVNVQMGCHGIGLSRLIAALAAVKRDDKGLAWPAVVAPFCVVVIPGKGNERAAEDVASAIQTHLRLAGAEMGCKGEMDVVLDDRDKPIGWKFKDADLIGYPVVVVVGRTYQGTGKVEVQCRQLGVKETLPSIFDAEKKNAPAEIAGYLARL
ncbi:hypothetical protein ANO11243_057340 [Dothideomycetidae sp. 11243]|nr:hypothetical protein ANO11243_057340 [fungal sp. No.11243]